MKSIRKTTRATAYISEHRQRRRKVRRYLFGALGAFALTFILVGTWWLVARSPVFRLQQVIVQGNEVVPSEDIVTLLQSAPSGARGFWPDLLGWNNILAWPDGISAAQLDMVPQVADMKIQKDYFSRTITVNVEERSPFGVWCFLSKGATVASSASSTDLVSTGTGSGSCYWFDDRGVLFEKATNTEGNLVVVVHDYSQSPRGLGQEVLPDMFDGNFVSIVNVLHNSGIGIQEMDLNDLSLEEIDAKTTAGPTIEFSLRFPADDYLGVLKSLISQGGFDKLHYVDCRTQDRVFYK